VSKMRVLWFTNVPMPAVAGSMGNSLGRGGYWMSELLKHLAELPEMRLAVVTAGRALPENRCEENGVEYFTVHQPRSSLFLRDPKSARGRCAEIVRRWAPDLVHVHGTEHFYGLVLSNGGIDLPCLVSLQGLLGPYSGKYFGGLSLWEVLRCQRLAETIRGSGLIWDYIRLKRNARREWKILQSNVAFAGRTRWDRAQLMVANPSARYFEVGEILREPFLRLAWRAGGFRRYSIMFSNADGPVRGTETLLEAMALLRGRFPDVRLRLAGPLNDRRGYGRLLRRRIYASSLAGCVEHLGYLRAGEMAEHLAGSHVFVMPSYLENSSNSLCEAMSVGVPCVASYTGGIPSLVENGRTGLLFPVGDAVSLADCIGSLFADEAMSTELGRAARRAALRRHSPQAVVNQLLFAYHEILRQSR